MPTAQAGQSALFRIARESRLITPCCPGGRIIQSTQVACAFCGEGIEFTGEDPIALGVVEHWRPHDEHLDWMTYSHRRCFVSRLHRETREAVDRDPGASFGAGCPEG